MKGNSGFNDVPKEVSKSRTGLLILFVLVIGIFIGFLVMGWITPANPLGQYINTRTCDFISMGEFSTAVCEDGTVWRVSVFQ